ncbi:MAG TPA: BMP family ABC transporter substrate-binding protein [Candidatus Wallbacteria bacterium]|nr:BMP family ABC transporter substrate-binding protein [Candidatus Wallbacteria bacterium]
MNTNRRGGIDNLALMIILSIVLILIFTFAYKAYLGFSGNSYSQCGIFLARGGGGDKGFNDLVIKGLQRVQNELKVELNFKSYQSDDQNTKDADYLLKKEKYDLLIGVGFEHEELFTKLSKTFKKAVFVIIDSYVPGKNVASLIFKEHEGGFLAGAFAAMVSKGKPIGFIGGMMIPPVERFCDGYVEGAKYVFPSINVMIEYVGTDPSAFANKAQGKKLALAMYKRGISIIFQAAGGSGLGVIDAAVESKKYVIGVDSDQSSLAPANVITSVEKRLDVVVFEFMKSTLAEGFKGGKQYFGVKEKAIRLSPFDYAKFKFINPEFETKIQKIEKDIINDKIKTLKNIKNLYD